MICVYDAACTDFSNNGLGSINPSSCQVTETLNGEYELTVIHPIDEIGKWQRLVEGNIHHLHLSSSHNNLPKVSICYPR